jgi:hypothetical protein
VKANDIPVHAGTSASHASDGPLRLTLEKDRLLLLGGIVLSFTPFKPVQVYPRYTSCPPFLLSTLCLPPAPLRASSWGELDQVKERGATRDTNHRHSSLSSLSAIQLGSHAIKGVSFTIKHMKSIGLIILPASVERAGLKPEDIEEVFVGNVLSAK